MGALQSRIVDEDEYGLLVASRTTEKASTDGWNRRYDAGASD